MRLGKINLRARFLLIYDIIVNCKEKHQEIEHLTKFVMSVQSIPVASQVKASRDNTLNGIEPVTKNRTEG